MKETDKIYIYIYITKYRTGMKYFLIFSLSFTRFEPSRKKSEKKHTEM